MTTVSFRGPLRNVRAEDPLLWREMSFTSTGFRALCAYRACMSHETGRSVPLGAALDDMLKTHPFSARSPEPAGARP
ncbi:hypothetical protein [Lysobacter sp. M2-1]|uniref:hypothetical protein n=1 Tax=Lysobacter sp. M2-1 TaxID=2916839 RepID=UPI001F56CE9E|nr:hypothetical protein [Lysobacter sp. M2-1]